MLCPIEENIYTELASYISSGSAKPSNSVAALIDAGWLSDKRPVSVSRPLSDDTIARIENNAHVMFLQVTQSCNLTCIYCPFATNSNTDISRHHSNSHMSLKTAKQAVDFLFKRSGDVDWVNIGFYGGEPLLNVDLMKGTVNYAKEKFDGKRINFFVTTNATLLNDEIIEFLFQNRFIITFSLDGPKEIHDRHRLRADGTPTYDTVMNNLKKTVDLYGDQASKCLAINMVINPTDDFDYILEWINDPVVSSIDISATLIETSMLTRKFDPNDDYLTKSTYKKAVDYLRALHLVDGLKPNRLFEKNMASLFSDFCSLKNDSVLLPDNNTPSGPCVPGYAKIFVSTEGMLYPCEKVNELAESMIIGSLDDGYDYKKISAQLNIASLTPDKCKNCFAQNHCTICQRQAADGQILSARKKEEYCAKTKSDFMDTLLACAMIHERKTVYNFEWPKETI